MNCTFASSNHKYKIEELSLIHISSIIRGMHRINIPGANVRLFPGDTIQVIGTDEQLGEFARDVYKRQVLARRTRQN